MTEKRIGRKGEKGGYGMIAKACSHRHRRWSSNEAGQVLVLVALAIFVLIGFVALAADVGFYRYKKRDMQKAADAGAIGGATERIYNNEDDPDLKIKIDSGARRDTSLNGYTHNPDDTDPLKRVTVTVNNPPESGVHYDKHHGEGRPPDLGEYVEVIIDQDQPTFFARIFGIDSVKVRARAVAYGGSAEATALGCVYALNSTVGPALHIQSTGTLVDADCNVYVDSNDPNNALQVMGGATLDANGISVVGGTKYQAGHVITEEGQFVTNASPQPDPFLAKTPPPVGPCDHTNFVDNGASSITLQPGVYCGGIQITGASRTVTFADGLYVLYGGGFRIQAGNDSIIYGGQSGGTTGVTFYNTGDGSRSPDGTCPTSWCYGSVAINAGAETKLYAPQVGDYAGFLFWQDPANTEQATFNGNSTTTLEGALYFPSAYVVLDGGNSTEAGYTVLIADTIKFSGQATFHITNENNPLTSGGSGANPTPTVVLVE